MQMTAEEFRHELREQMQERGYTSVMDDVIGIVTEFDRLNFVGLFPYWRFQAHGLRYVIQLAAEKDLTVRARPHVEEFLRTASERERELIDEFIGVIDGRGDSGSVHETLRALIKLSGIEYVKRCLDTIERDTV